ncbi:MAG: glycosyltransferase family 4 protein [Ilumatobacteraceae bacterium]
MTADRGSAIEKTIMLAVARAARKRTAFYPVAHGIFDDAARSTFWRVWLRQTVRLSTLVICQGKTIADAVQRLGGTPDQCRVVPNLADLSEVYGDLDEEKRSNEIVFLGWLTASKGIFDLLAAIQQSNELRTVPFVICGDGADGNAARTMAADQGLTNVRFMGWVETDHQVREILKGASTLVLPSYTEGMPGTIIEALAAGAVVVTTPVGVIADYVVHDESGLIVPVGDPAALACALERVQRDPELRVRLRRNGQQLARAAFDKDHAYEHLSEALRHMAREEA